MLACALKGLPALACRSHCHFDDNDDDDDDDDDDDNRLKHY